MLVEKTPSKYSYLRIIHYGYDSYLHQLSVHELGPHPPNVFYVFGFSGKSRGDFMCHACPSTREQRIYSLVMADIAMENGPFIDGLPIKNGDFPWLC